MLCNINNWIIVKAQENWNRYMTFQTTSSNKSIIKNDSLHLMLLPTDK